MTTALIDALKYAALEWRVIPLNSITQAGGCTCGDLACNAPGKHPLTPHGLQDGTIDPDIIDGWWQRWPWANIGIVTGALSGIVVLDIDPRHNGDDTLFELQVQNGKLPDKLESLTGGGGRHLIFSHPGRKVPNDSKGLFFGPGIDVRGDGGYIVVPPSNHKSGNAYEWEASSEPGITRLADLPAWALARIPSPQAPGTSGKQQQAPAASRKVRAGQRNATLTSMAGAMRRKGMPVAAIEAALEETNKELCDPPLSAGEIQTIAKSVGKYRPAGATPTDDEIAQAWIDKFPDMAYGLLDFRRYAGGIWQPVNEESVKREILEIAINEKGNGYKPNTARVRSVMDLARSILFVAPERWNQDSNLLACKNGTLEIDALNLREHRKEDYLTSGVPYDYVPYTDDSQWLQFLDDTVPLAAEFLQEFAGYSLTTDTQYEVAVWLYGPRGSGKSTLIEGFRAMLGTRAGLLGLAQIEDSRFALGDLPSKTLLFSTEQPSDYIKSGHILNALISGELVRVERKFKAPEDIIPRAKIIWGMNELPRIREASSGLFRRVKVVEFPALQVKPNPLVKENIKHMGAAILNWALYGLQRLKNRRYFDIPDCVQQATNQFEESNDIARIFVEEKCETGNATYETQSSKLYEAYRTWCIENGHHPKSSTAIAAEDWKRLGFIWTKKTAGNVWKGIRLI